MNIEPKRKLAVMNLEENQGNEVILNMFKVFGNVIHFNRPPMSKRYAFVTYEDLRCVCVCVQIIHRNRFNSTFYSFLLFIGQSVAVVRLKLLTSHCKGRAWKWSTQKTNRCRITRCLQLIRSTQPRPKWRKPPFETSSYFCLFSLLFIFPRFVELARLMYTIFFILIPSCRLTSYSASVSEDGNNEPG